MSRPASAPRLLDELKQTRSDIIKTCGPGALLALVAFLIALYFVEPPPPRELVIATGLPDGNYYAAAQQYSSLFSDNGITLRIRETAGSVENYELLRTGAVQLAIVQGGTAPTETPVIESLATLYLEPLWVFHPAGASVARLTDLGGKRISIGQEGGGTEALSRVLLEANGVDDGDGTTEFIHADGQRAAEMLRAGEVDAAFFVLGAESKLVRDLLSDPQLRLMNFERARAYAQRYPFLQAVSLARGVIDLQHDVPSRDVTLIAPAANLVATPELHDAFIPLLLEAATETHQMGGLVTEPGKQPSLDAVEFPPNAVARHYLKFGPSFFQEYLGFWLSSLIDRTKIMLVPLIVLLVPLVKLAPPVYRWRIRSRIYRWYAILREIDQGLASGDEAELEEINTKLVRIESELRDVTVPLSYMEEFYHLRLHIDLVKQRVDERLTG